VSDGSRHEPFCTVLLEQVSESISSFKRAVYRPNQMVRLPLEAGPSQDTACIRVTLSVMFVSQNPQTTPSRRQFVRAGPSGDPRRHTGTLWAQGSTRDCRCANRGEGMFLASKAVWAGIVFILLTTISEPRPTPLASGANSKEVPAVGPLPGGQPYSQGACDVRSWPPLS